MTETHKIVRNCALVFAVVLAASIVLGAVSLLFAIFGTVGGYAGEETVYTFETGEVQALQIDIGEANLTVVRGEGLSVTVNSDRIKAEAKDGTLKIEGPKKLISFGNNPFEVTVTLPSEAVFSSVNIETGAGSLKLHELSSETLTLKLGAGKVDISDITVTKSMRVEGGAGEISISGASVNALDLDAGVGEIEIEGRLTGSCDIDTGVGELELRLEGGRESYTVEAETGVGEFSVGGEKISGSHTTGSGPNVIDISGGVGEISVIFR